MGHDLEANCQDYDRRFFVEFYLKKKEELVQFNTKMQTVQPHLFI
jgi:hypothetical protein